MAIQIEKLYKRTEEALKKKNYDLAIEMLKNQILKFTPDDVKARKLLRGTVKEKHKTHGAPSKGQVMSKGIGARAKIKIAQMSKKWDVVIEEAENYLLVDPENVGILYILGEACLNAGYTDTAIFVFENIYQVEPTHIKSLMKLSEVYKTKESFDKAMFYCQKALQVNPNDAEISREIKRIAAQKTSKVYVGADSTQDLIKDKEKARELEKKQKNIRTEEDALDAIDIIEKQLRESPENKRLLREASELYLRLAKYKTEGYDKAIEHLTTLLKLEPTNFDTKHKLARCKIDKASSQLEYFEKKSQQNPNDEAVKQKLKQLQKNKILSEITEYKKLVDERPTESELRFKLGKAFFMNKQFDDAIANFQQAIQAPLYRVDALNYMGQAFLKKQNFSLAETQFKNALEGLAQSDKKYKGLLYSLGIVYESGGKKQDAIDTYTALLNIDIQYKDVSARLDKLR